MADTTIIKFKRGRTCYVVPILLDTKSRKTVKHVKGQLLSAINSSGGLSIEDTSELDTGKVELAPEDIQLAFPKAKEAPYANEWVPIEDDLLIQTVIFNDQDLVVFKHSDDADFHLQQIEYQE